MTVRIRKILPVLLLALPAVGTLRASRPYERYVTIIERKPFGPEPAHFDPEAAPGSAAADAAAQEAMNAEQRTVEEQQLAASVRVSMINITPSGSVAVGFTDSAAKPEVNYYLVVGRSQNGWTVKAADPAAESVTLEKDGTEVTVKLGEVFNGGTAKGAKKRAANRPMTLQAAPEAQPAAQAAGAPAPAAEGLGGLARLRLRRAERRAKEKAAEAEKAAEREAREAAERQERAEREARAEEERAQQREDLRRQIQEEFMKRDREAREAREAQEAQGETDNAE